MAMGRRNRRQRQKDLWVAAVDMPKTAAHPFYRQLNKLLDEHGFDVFVEGLCERFYAPTMGRPSLTPGLYFRSLLIGYFEGIDSERGIGWRIPATFSPHPSGLSMELRLEPMELRPGEEPRVRHH